MKWRCHKCAVIISSVTLSSSLSSTIMMMINHCPGEDIAAVVTFAVPLFCWAQECGVTEIGWMGICTNVQWHQGSKLRTRCCGKTEEILTSAHAWVPFHASVSIFTNRMFSYLQCLILFKMFSYVQTTILLYSPKSCTPAPPLQSMQLMFKKTLGRWVCNEFWVLCLQWVLRQTDTILSPSHWLPHLKDLFNKILQISLLVQKHNGNWIQNRTHTVVHI